MLCTLSLVCNSLDTGLKCELQRISLKDTQLLATGETEQVHIFGVVPAPDGPGLLFCDYRHKSLKEWQLGETPRIIYKSEWNILNVLVLNANRLAVLEKEPLQFPCSAGNLATKPSTRRSRIEIVKRDGDAFHVDKALLLAGTSPVDETTVEEASSGHLFVSFNGFHVLYELAVGRVLSLAKSHVMDSRIRSATLVKTVDSENLYVSFYNNTLRE